MELKLTIREIGEIETILATEDALLIRWPKEKLPADILVGQSLVFSITSPGMSEPSPKATAKEILNELLDIE